MSHPLIHPHAQQDTFVSALRAHLQPLTSDASACDGLMQMIGNASLVLLGEASHGTHEFYAERAAITQRLILEKGCQAVVIEADWPDAWRVNRYVRGPSPDPDARAALEGFKRFPTWMWRNTVVLDFVEWLRTHNRDLPAAQQVGFYGMDLYSLFASIEAVLKYLDQVDPQAAAQARARYGCFDHFDQDSQAYGYACSFGTTPSCEEAVIQQWRDMNRRVVEAVPVAGMESDEAFYAQQNARLVRNAEAYYRTMFSGRVSSWNLRDSHMVETLQALARHMQAHGVPPRLAVWAHNSHLGHAGATEMGAKGEWNVGQLAREIWGERMVSVGFSTHHGSVTAAAQWDAPAQRRHVRPGLAGSYEALFHQTKVPRFWLALRDDTALRQLLAAPRLQRAIGVIYHPQTERQSHYFHTHLPTQFDALIHIDETRALVPLEKDAGWVRGEVPETFPSGL
jgi:erythromycin esterase-like protein